MRQKSNSTPASETLVRNIRRATRKHHAAEEKIRIALDGLRGETTDEVKQLRREAQDLKEVVAEQALELRPRTSYEFADVSEQDISIRGAGATARDMCENFGKKRQCALRWRYLAHK